MVGTSNNRFLKWPLMFYGNEWLEGTPFDDILDKIPHFPKLASVLDAYS